MMTRLKKRQHEQLSRIFKAETPDLFDELVQQLTFAGYHVESGSKHVFARSVERSPVLMVAHCDTVHHFMPQHLFYDREQGVMWDPEGLGADDRAGVFSIMELIDRGHRPHILFTDEEESGGVGATQASFQVTLPHEVNVLIELDRAGSNDAVYYGCGNKDIRKWVREFGFKEDQGSFTDISILMRAWDIAGVNLSIGYYRQHTTEEMLSIPQMLATIKRVEEMLSSPPAERFPYDGISLVGFRGKYDPRPLWSGKETVEEEPVNFEDKAFEKVLTFLDEYDLEPAEERTTVAEEMLGYHGCGDAALLGDEETLMVIYDEVIEQLMEEYLEDLRIQDEYDNICLAGEAATNEEDE